MLPVLVLLSVAACLLIHLVPGDPARVNLGLRATPERIAQERARLGLDRPIADQYWGFVSGAATFDFGKSSVTDEEVGTVIRRRAGASFLLVGMALFVMLAIAVPLATLAARFKHTWLDQAIRFGSTITFVMPPFWLALLLVSVFSLQLGLLPTSGYGDTLPQHLEGLALPALTIGLALSPLLLRMLRDSEVDTLQSEYVEAARARGLTERRIMFKHVLRNSVTSTVTLLGIVVGILFSATVVVEQIFAIPGLGSLLVNAVAQRDYAVVQALTLLFGVIVLVASLATDIIYALIDPRVRL
jgi:peptide/nickel transport system permease protein